MSDGLMNDGSMDDRPMSVMSTATRREAARDGLRAVRSVLVEAELVEHPAERYLTAHRAALGVAAVVLALRAGSRSAAARATRQDAWRLVARVAPEYAEWAGFFAATRGRREEAHRYCSRPDGPAPTRQGSGPVTAREADDMVREAHRFADLVWAGLTVRSR